MRENCYPLIWGILKGIIPPWHEKSAVQDLGPVEQQIWLAYLPPMGKQHFA